MAVFVEPVRKRRDPAELFVQLGELELHSARVLREVRVSEESERGGDAVNCGLIGFTSS